MTARDLILEADTIARGQGLTQAAWSRAAGRAQSGQTVSRILARGECKISTLLELLEPLGYELAIRKEGDSQSGTSEASLRKLEETKGTSATIR